jgi:hypothetical protein
LNPEAKLAASIDARVFESRDVTVF